MSAHSPRVVLVEDEEPVRQAVERALRHEGIAVTGFSDYPNADRILAVAANQRAHLFPDDTTFGPNIFPIGIAVVPLA